MGTVAVPFCLLICLRACAGVHWLYAPCKYGAADMETGRVKTRPLTRRSLTPVTQVDQTQLHMKIEDDVGGSARVSRMETTACVLLGASSRLNCVALYSETRVYHGDIASSLNCCIFDVVYSGDDVNNVILRTAHCNTASRREIVIC